MKHAKQIFLDFNLEVGKSLVRHPVVAKHAMSMHGVGVGGFRGGRFIRRYMPKKYADMIKNLLPEKVQPFLMGTNLTEIRLLAPHIHLEEKCVINFYLHTNGEVTSFWEGKIERYDDLSTDNGNGYLNVNPTNLTLIETFVAKPGECWILDTCQPHSVSYQNDVREDDLKYEPTNPDDARWVIQSYFSAPFQQIADSFENI